jgi:D-glycero-D-manno-heptose 1,7-bisphosphate phosphatase
MLFRARDDLGLELGASILVGDKWSDIEAGRAAGVRRLCLLDSEGRGVVEDANDVLVCASLRDAARALFPSAPLP